MHFQSADLKQVILEQNTAWDSLLQQGVAIPTPRLYRYNAEGNLMSIQHIDGQEGQTSGSEPESEKEDSLLPFENQYTATAEEEQSTADTQTMSREVVEFADTLVDPHSDNQQVTRRYKQTCHRNYKSYW